MGKHNPPANCLLPTANCLLPTAYCQLPTANCLLPTALCLLPTAYCVLPSAYCLLQGAEQAEYVQPMLLGVKDGERAAIPSHHDVGLGGLHMRHPRGCGVGAVTHHDIARPDGDAPQRSGRYHGKPRTGNPATSARAASSAAFLRLAAIWWRSFAGRRRALHPKALELGPSAHPVVAGPPPQKQTTPLPDDEVSSRSVGCVLGFKYWHPRRDLSCS